MSDYDINIQRGHIARHTPRNAGAQGREAAIVDIAQDLLLRHLHDVGILDMVAIKGGTALRKLYSGNEGRFSLDLDFAVADIGLDRDDCALEFVNEVDGLTIGPFNYGASERRGRWSISFRSRFASEITLQTKLDFSSSPWLDPVEKEWVYMPIHERYGGPLPRIRSVRLEENLAEKIARLNRTTTARDMYDLAWISGNASLWRSVDKDLVRRLAVLKIWVDTNGVHSPSMSWGPAHQGSVFDARHWLRKRTASEFNLEDIGALAVPTPRAEDLSAKVSEGYAFLLDLDNDEVAVARSDPRDRALVLKMLSELPGGRLAGGILY